MKRNPLAVLAFALFISLLGNAMIIHWSGCSEDPYAEAHAYVKVLKVGDRLDTTKSCLVQVDTFPAQTDVKHFNIVMSQWTFIRVTTDANNIIMDMQPQTITE